MLPKSDNYPQPVIDKFWSHVEKTSYCWNWIGTLQSNGSPSFIKNGLGYSPRRVSLYITGHDTSQTKMAKPLICKNKLCVNPDHLVMGDAARFWSKVQKLTNDCWVWMGALDKEMYGTFTVSKNETAKNILAHRYSWMLHFGNLPPSNVLVCHRCDHPWCVNPEHLFLGDVTDNNRDCNSKGRRPIVFGESHANSKLTEEKVREIRKLSTTISSRKLAKMYGVSSTLIDNILKGKSWKRVS